MSLKKLERKRLAATYGRLYQRHRGEGVNRNRCFYCNDPAQTLDHSPPLSWVEAMTVKEWRLRRVPFVLIPACMSCNFKLGDKPLFTAEERVRFIADKLERMYEKNHGLWSKEEIDEMGFSFRALLKEKNRLNELLLSRVRFAQWRGFHAESMPVFEKHEEAAA